MEMSPRISKLIILISFFVNFSAHAGWVSGGGELIEDAQNPWFFSNTKEVKYCVLVDESNFGQNIGAVRKRIRMALDFWKLQFQHTVNISYGNNDYKLATQNFTEVPCNQAPALRFQFGVLTGEQMEKIRNPTQYVGLTIRTDYDKVNLRGNGFIYISPQNGPLKLNLLNNETIQSEWKPWLAANGSLLLPVLIHELGHIFGLSHDDDIFLMGERSMETLLTIAGGHDERFRQALADFWEGTEKNNTLANIRVFLASGNFLGDLSICISVPRVPRSPIEVPLPAPTPSVLKTNKNVGITQNLINRFFKIEPEDLCIREILRDNVFTVQAAFEPGDNYRLIGSANLITPNVSSNQKSMVKAWLPKEQKVFSYVSNYQPETIALMEKNRLYKGTFTFTDGSTPRKIFVTSYPGGRGLVVGGELDGELYMDLDSGF